MIKEEYVDLLLELGFNRTQSKLYLTLIQLGETDVKDISKRIDISRQEIYRTLNQLQEAGYVEKILALPTKYKAIPFKDLLLLIQEIKANEYRKTLERTQFLLSNIEEEKQERKTVQDCTIRIVEGKETIINNIRVPHANAQNTICCFSTFQRWIHIGNKINETIQRALKRGVNYRIIIEKPTCEINLPIEVKSQLENQNFQVKLFEKKLNMNGVIFDSKLLGFSLYTSKSINETPMIWTNHIGLIGLFQDYFEKLWAKKEAVPIEKSLETSCKKARLNVVNVDITV